MDELDRLEPGERFIERMGLAAEAEGLTRIAGRLMGLMLLEGGPFGFDELVERLQVSRGSVSTNTRLLEQRGIIQRTSRPGDRHLLYRLADDPCNGLLANVLRRKRAVARIVGETLEELPDEREESRRRLRNMLCFHEMVIRQLEKVIQEWEDDSAGEG